MRENHLLMKAILQKTPHTLFTSNSGRQALDIFLSTHVDLIFMDIIMPDLDGYRSAYMMRGIENSEGRRRTPIVALTSGDIPRIQEKSLAAGYDLVIAKPIKKELIFHLIDHFHTNGAPPSGAPHEHPDSAAHDPTFATLQHPVPEKEPLPELPLRERIFCSAHIPDPGHAIDRHKLATLQRDLREHVKPLLESYVTSLPVSLQTITRAWHRADFKSLALVVHNLKGSASLIGADRLLNLAADMEKVVHLAIKNSSGNSAENVDLLELLLHEGERVLQEIREFLSKPTNPVVASRSK
ncbi:MAG: response regulator [Magnetococcales bacterium]|nr:response regulator [Magnetococcales bacterium]